MKTKVNPTKLMRKRLIYNINARINKIKKEGKL
jgi:hypothetical protein